MNDLDSPILSRTMTLQITLDVDMFIFTSWHIHVAIMTYGVIIFTVTAKFLWYVKMSNLDPISTHSRFFLLIFIHSC